MSEFDSLLAGSGEMGSRIRAYNWTKTPLGPPEHWPQSLRSALSICLHSSFPMAIYWGDELRLLYNDAWAPIPGPRHPDALGRPAHEVWPDIWHIVGPQFHAVMETGDGFTTQDRLLPMRRFGQPEETYWDYSFTPITGEDGKIVGILNQGQDRTVQVLNQQRAALIVELNDRLRALNSPNRIIATALAMVGEYLDAGRVGYGEIDSKNGVIHVEPCWTSGLPDAPGDFLLESFGRDIHETLRAGRTYLFGDVLADPRTATPETIALYTSAGVRATLVMPVLQDGVYVAAMVVHDHKPRNWTGHEEALLRAVAHRVWQEVRRARAETALRVSEERHRLIFEQANDIIFTTDLDQVITSCNPAAAAIFDTMPEAMIGRSVREFLTPEAYERTVLMLQQKLDHGGTTRHDVELMAGPSRLRRWEVSSGLAIDADGRAIGINVIARDVTEQRAFGERQQLLINELNHRVKNMLALVQSLALQSTKGVTPSPGYAKFQGRLDSLAAAHDLLTREQWEGVTLGELIVDATRVHAEPAGRIHTSGPIVMITPRAAIALVLALHELGTNAAKYGALSSPDGAVDIHWAIADGRLRIEWRERGGPPVTAPLRRGFGLRMIERALAADLDGTATVTFPPEGLSCVIDAPEPGRPL